MPRLVPVPIALIAGLGCACEPPPEPAPPPPPDILLVVLDTVRKDRLSCYGYERDTSPRLDDLARRGAVFEDVTASGTWTWPAHASLFTGELPWRHGAHFTSLEQAAFSSEAASVSVAALDPTLPTLAEQLGARGYRTVSLSSNSLLQPELGLTRGFDEARYLHHASLLERDKAATADAVEQMERPGDQPLFLFVNLLSAHAPFVVTPAPWIEPLPTELTTEPLPVWFELMRNRDAPGLNIYNTEADSGHRVRDLYAAGQLELPPDGLALLSDLYDGNVRLVDYLLGELLDGWQRTHPDGIVAVVSDHGELLGEHGLLDHGRSVWPQLTDVPVVLYAPDHTIPGQRIETPRQLADLQPTLLAMATGEPSARSMLAESQPGPIRAMAWPDHFAAASGAEAYQHGWQQYREDGWALVLRSDGAPPQLFDVEADPGMLADQAADQPELLARLQAAAATAFPERAPVAVNPVELPEDVQRSLEALGYVDPRSPAREPGQPPSE